MALGATERSMLVRSWGARDWGRPLGEGARPWQGVRQGVSWWPRLGFWKGSWPIRDSSIRQGAERGAAELPWSPAPPSIPRVHSLPQQLRREQRGRSGSSSADWAAAEEILIRRTFQRQVAATLSIVKSMQASTGRRWPPPLE